MMFQRQGAMSKRNELNERLANYQKLNEQQRSDLRQSIKRAILQERQIQRGKINTSRLKFDDVNLIVGATGSGKSTFFNYLHNLPLTIEEARDRSNQMLGTGLLIIDQRFLKNNKGIIYSPIGAGFTSVTTEPIFNLSLSRRYINVDCPGVLDNRDIIQSLLNSIMIQDFFNMASRIKLTIVVSCHELNDRMNAFKTTIQEVEKFFGTWQRFDPSAVCLIVTHVRYKNPHETVRNILEQISSLQSIKGFSPVLKSILARNAFGVMPVPYLKENVVTNELQVPKGQPYLPKLQDCTVRMMNQVVDATEFMTNKDRLFCPSVKEQASRIIQDICFGLIKQTKKQILNVIVNNIKKKNKKDLLKILQNMQSIKNIEDLLQLFKLNKDLERPRLDDLDYFSQFSKLEDYQSYIVQVTEDVSNFIQEIVNKMNQQELANEQKRAQRRRKQQQRQKRRNGLYDDLGKKQDLIKQTIKRMDEIKRQKARAKRDEKQYYQNLFQSCEYQLKQYDEQWAQIKDQISDIEDEEERKERKVKVDKWDDDLSPYDNDYMLEYPQMKTKIVRIKRKIDNWKRYKTSNDHIYKLSVERKINQLQERLQACEQIMQDLTEQRERQQQQKMQELKQIEEEIEKQMREIGEYAEEKRKARTKDDRESYQNQIEYSRSYIEGSLVDRWIYARNALSQLLDEQVDYDLSKEGNDQELGKSQLKDKIKRLSRNLIAEKNKLQKSQKYKEQYLECRRKLKNIEERRQTCQSILENMSDQ